MTWPSPQDYAEAVQSPQDSFEDPELRPGQVTLNALGLPRCSSGNFATVFCMENGNKKVAVRCFLSNVLDQEERYAEISKFVLSDDLPYTVGFAYLKRGIRIRGEWYPILKMDWVEGETLGAYLDRVREREHYGMLAGYFKQMTLELNRAGIAHGDLQHDNIMISDTELRLVDYDGMFVPSLKGRNASELGHRNYQHPSRNVRNFDYFLDNFSAWVIYASLRCLALDPSLWGRLHGGNDCLLFRNSDFVSPETSDVFAVLDGHELEKVRRFGEVIRQLLAVPIEEVPTLESPLHDRVLLRERSSPSDKPGGGKSAALNVTISSDCETAGTANYDGDAALDVPSSVQSPIQNLPAAWCPDAYYADISKIEAELPFNGLPLCPSIVDIIEPQLMPGEVLNFSSSTKPVESMGGHLAKTLVMIFLLVPVAFCLLLGVLQLMPFGWIVGLSSFFIFLSLFSQKKKTVYLVTDRRIIIVKAGYDISPYAYSIPFDSVDFVRIEAGASAIEVHAKQAFRTPEGTFNVLMVLCKNRVEFLRAMPNSVRLYKP